MTAGDHEGGSGGDTSARLPMLERRRIEARVLKHVYDTLSKSHSKDVAARTIAAAVRAASIEQAREMASEVGGDTSLQSFVDLQSLWTMNGALEIEMLEQTGETFSFNVTRCRYAEMYRDMGLGEIGHLLSCQRDGTFCEGYDERLKLTRTQTIMQGASHCDFRYRYIADDGDPPEPPPA
ncbi:MAG: L-2-amino-thiazoline-4-carboxylic acid hydrolase [Hyphomicrobiaceae bacterium]